MMRRCAPVERLHVEFANAGSIVPLATVTHPRGKIVLRAGNAHARDQPNGINHSQ
jgi:hypothetical protein